MTNETRDYIYNKVPLLRPSTDTKFVVVTDDSDAMLSTILYLLANPGAKVIGMYCDFRYTIGYTHPELTTENTLWVDADMYLPSTISIGHHWLHSYRSSCFNPNELKSDREYSRKYPFNTACLLMDLYTMHMPSTFNSLVVCADGVNNNYFSKYPDNCRNWINSDMHKDGILGGVINSYHANGGFGNLVTHLSNIGCQIKNGSSDNFTMKYNPQESTYNILAVLDAFCAYSGIPVFDSSRVVTDGAIGVRRFKRTQIKTSGPNEGIPQNIPENSIISYAQVYSKKLNITTMEE